jgi:hypothetical protein
MLLLRCLLPCAMAGSSLLGCASLAAPPARGAAAQPPETFDPDLSVLPAGAVARYDSQRFEIRFAGPKQQPTLMRGTRVTAEPDFRKAYRELMHTSELDMLAHKRARHDNPKMIAAATGMTLLGVGGIALLASPGSGCSKNEASCAKGAVSAALFAAGGLYGLGCEALKGVKCLEDQGHFLKREELEQSVAAYNIALVTSLRSR